MDDNLEKPTSAVPRKDNGDGDQSSGEEDDSALLDWSKLSGSSARTAIPKRGEKDFEPKPGGGSGLQQYVLDRARSSMFDAVRGVRATSGKSLSYGIWYPTIARVHITIARGNHLSSMGHSVSRPLGAPKRLELLPEEAIYMIERGSLFCFKDCPHLFANEKGKEKMVEDLERDGVHGQPISVQQAYSEMIGKDELTLERLQVYTYLRRLGYVVTRTVPPTPDYPTAAPYPEGSHASHTSIMKRIRSLFGSWWQRTLNAIGLGFNWWHPLRINRWLLRSKRYSTIYHNMRQLIPCGHRTPLLPPQPPPSKTSPYQFFYNVYKPSTPFKRTAPGVPDFQMVVIDARTTPMPTLHELTALFEQLPELPPPKPRKRTQQPQAHPPSKGPVPTQSNLPKQPQTTPPVPQLTPASPSTPTSFLQRLKSLFSKKTVPTLGVAQPQKPRPPNPFAVLKAGRKMAIIAVVDGGSIGFFRLCEGAFEDWCMM